MDSDEYRVKYENLLKCVRVMCHANESDDFGFVKTSLKILKRDTEEETVCLTK